MKKHLSLLVSMLLIAMMLVGCTSANEAAPPSDASTSASDPASDSAADKPQGDAVSITHKLGEVTVTGIPQKVVVFDFGMLDTIDELALNVEIALPKSNVPGYLEKYNTDAYTNAGDIKEPDLEAINAFQPDLIIISGRQADYYADLSGIAPTLYVEVDSSRYMDDFKQNVGWIGQIFDKTAEVDAKIAEIEAVIADTQAKVNPEEKALIVLTNDGSVSAYGSGSRFGIIHDVFGVAQADSGIAVSTHGQEVNYEYISEMNPDILFVVDRTTIVGGENTAQKTLDNDLVNATSAVANGRVYYLDPNVWYLSGGGLQSVAEMARAIAEIF